MFGTMLLMLALGTAATDSTPLRREALMAALKRGGYTILARHGATDWSFNEQRDPVPMERSQQRNLTPEGIEQGRALGSVFKKYQVPIGEILSSQMYRTRETAELLAGPPSITTVLRTFPTTAEQAALVAVVPAPSTNRLLVTHHFVIETHVPGIRPGDVGEGEAAVVRPLGQGKVELVGRITLDDIWALSGRPATHGAAPASSPAGVTGSAQAATPAKPPEGPEPELPTTPAGRLVGLYLRAFNSGDAATMRGFFETAMAPNPQRSVDERVERYLKLYGEHGRFRVLSVERSEENEVELRVESKRGTVRVTMDMSPEHPGRGRSVSFRYAAGH